MVFELADAMRAWNYTLLPNGMRIRTALSWPGVEVAARSLGIELREEELLAIAACAEVIVSQDEQEAASKSK